MNLPNNKTFSILVKKSKTYELLISGFSKTSLWFATIISRLGFITFPRLIKSISVSLENLLGISLSTPRLIKKSTSTTSFVNTIALIGRGIYKVSSNISTVFSSSLVARLIKKASTSYQSIVDFTLSILVATFTLLSVYDPDALSTIDTETLADLDYTIA